MLATSNKIRKFAIGFDLHRSLPDIEDKVICITLPFDSRKSGTFEMIGKVAVDDARVCICVSYFCSSADSGLPEPS